MTNQQRKELDALRDRLGMKNGGPVADPENWMEERRRAARIARGVCPRCGSARHTSC